jgi:site-specific recombinase XerD
MEKNQIENLEILISKALNYMISEGVYAPATIIRYTNGWNGIRNFMIKHGIEEFNEQIEEKMLPLGLGTKSDKHYKEAVSRRHRLIRNLLEFEATGKFAFSHYNLRGPITFSGPMSSVIDDFLEYKTIKDRLSIESIDKYQRCLLIFDEYCRKAHISNIKDLKLKDVLNFLNAQKDHSTPIREFILGLRGLLDYAYAEKHIEYPIYVPKYKVVKQPRLPVTYSEEEINKIVESTLAICSSSIGKRDYVILLLAIKLGLRASDISLLKFENIDWENCTIRLAQYKTGKELILPLLPDIGNAIIDYLKYGRLRSDSAYLLLTEKTPFGRPVNNKIVTSAVQRAFNRSKIDTQGRKIGAHALRHSLASQLIRKHTLLPVITEVLGHSSVESTRYYLKIDLQSLSDCALQVPPVPAAFYMQKGGLFYAR